MAPKARLFWPLLLAVLLSDCSTKDLVMEHLTPGDPPVAVVDDAVRLTVIQNPGTAFGIDLRPYIGAGSRVALIAGMGLIALMMFRVYHRTPPTKRLLGAAFGLICGGALGNLYDRVRFPAGVVDFIDVGIGTHRFWIFNVADAGISVGAVLLIWAIWREEHPLANSADVVS